MQFLVLLLTVLMSSSAHAAGSELLTVLEADRISLETNTIIVHSAGALSFFLGWVAGAST